MISSLQELILQAFNPLTLLDIVCIIYIAKNLLKLIIFLAKKILKGIKR